jgi:hypothetical protein
MKLRLIVEDISKQEFYDFYALLYSYSAVSNIHKAEVGKALKYVADMIYDDHINQLLNIILDRIIDTKHESTISLLDQYGLHITDDFEIIGLDNLSLQDKAALLKEIIVFKHHHGFTGDTWFGLASKILELAYAGTSLDAKIRAIDHMYQMMHHGGQITDYMDESHWLEAALNYRDNANPQDMLARSSSWVRDLLGPYTLIHSARGNITELHKLYTATRRAAGGREIDITLNGGKLTLSAVVTPLLWNNEYPRASRLKGYAPWISIGGFISKVQELVDLGMTKPGKSTRQQLTVALRPDRFVVQGPVNSVAVPLPVNRYYQFADDIIGILGNFARGKEEIRHGYGIGDIKESYYFDKNGRPVNLANLK